MGSTSKSRRAWNCLSVSLLELQMTEQRKRRQRMGFVDVQNTMNH